MDDPPPDELRPLIAEQVRYYRAAADEFDDLRLALPGGEELDAALDAFEPAGDVLELACGPGTWTRRLLHHATTVTALDSSPEMLSIAGASVRDPRVRFVQADVFSWRPDRRYDAVFFGFWLSHVPLECFESFWSTVDDSLEAQGRVFFVDDGYRTPEELVGGATSSVIRRRLRDGSTFNVIKVPHEPADLERRLRDLGWDVTVTGTRGPFYWGAGRRA